MNFSDWVVEVDIVSLVLVVLGSFVAYFVYHQWAPLVNLDLSSRWSNGDSGNYLIISVRFSNPSRIRIKKPAISFQAKQYSIDEIPLSSDFLDFTGANQIYPKDSTAPTDNPEGINKYLNPGETISIDKLIKLDANKQVVHFGLQYKRDYRCREWQQTTTAYAVIPKSSSSSSQGTGAKT